MKKTAIITGGAGFIGCNLADRLLRLGWRVAVADNLSRRGTEKNLRWLKERHSGILFERTDVRNAKRAARLFEKYATADLVAHLAGQVAVTSSITAPRADFEANALGTLNVLEGVRAAWGLSPSRKVRSPFFIYASTNKVYGGMERVACVRKGGRWAYRDFPRGIPETVALDFHSPYGCSKGAADQYVMDYARIYGLAGVSFRQSCIYGERQFGVEDQGWVAWFAIAAATGRPITLYGDGTQVRDMLYIGDLVDAYLAAYARRGKTAGQAYNIGGGPENAMSLLQLAELLEKLMGRKITLKRGKKRPGDQPVFIADVRKASRDFGWRPATSAPDGVKRLLAWVRSNSAPFR